MPYRHAHWWVLAVFPLAALAFWPGYLSAISTAPPEMHLHGITATLWLILLVLQSWLASQRRFAAHRLAGRASLMVFPAFIAGGMAISIGMARRFAAHDSPFYEGFAPRLTLIDLVSVAAFALLFFIALKERARVRTHAPAMLATVLLLLPPILGRLVPLLPPLAIHGPEEFWKLVPAFQMANAISLTIALVLYLRARPYGGPFLLTAGAIALGATLFQFVGPLPAWVSLFGKLADVPSLPAILTTAAIGAAISWAGWRAGKRPSRGSSAA